MPSWPSYLRTFVITAVVSVIAMYLFIALVDPYDNVPFSLPLEREPISTNQRFAYPSLARKAEFDSAIIGTSTARLLKPERLNKLTGDNWVNLAMNSATAYEQMEMLKLFLRHHPNAKNIVIGIDDAWCRPGKEIQKYTFRPFPPWMYDENRWNDLLYLFNDKALENAVRLIEYWLGKREAKYDRTGYRDFTEDFGEYDKVTVKARLYGNSNAKPGFIEASNIEPYPSLKPRMKVYPDHLLLDQKLTRNMRDAQLSILYMPLHGYYLNQSLENYRQCKTALHAIFNEWQNVRIIDRMHLDELTLNDDNYWDPLHYTSAVSDRLEEFIAGVSEQSH